MVKIDWNQLELNSNNSKEISFERFCYHFANIRFRGYGKFIYPYNAPGSEFYLILSRPLEYDGENYNVGDIIGWQAKFWVNHNDMENSSLTKERRQVLKKGLADSIKRNPKLALWIICTPGQFVEDAYNDLKKDLALVSEKIKITHWHKVVFETAFVGEDSNQYNGLFTYYFCDNPITKKSLDKLTKNSLEKLKKKFDIDLHSASTFENRLMGIIDKDKAYSILVKRIRKLKDEVERYNKRWFDQDANRKETDFNFTTGISAKSFYEYEDRVLEIATHLICLLKEKDVDIISREGLSIIESKMAAFENSANRLNEELEHAPNKKEIAYYWNYIAEDIVDIKNLIFGKRNSRDESIYHDFQIRSSHYFPVFGHAGYGKTHLACSLASQQLSLGKPVLLLTGNQFCKCVRPQDVFLEQFGMLGKMSFEDLIKSLDLLSSFYSDNKILIIVDGLNESFPNEGVWKQELSAITNCIKKSDHIILLTTCRDKTEYIQKIYDELSYEQVENYSLLTGIEDFNLLETIHKYFSKYNIKGTRIVAKDSFKNPLLLKIFCEVNKGNKGIVVDEYSLTKCIQSYSKNLVDSISTGNGAINKVVGHRIENGLKQMGRVLWERNTRSVDYYDDFYKFFGDKCESLLDEGLCFQVDKVSFNSGEIMFTYDLLAGYHIANYLISLTKAITDLSDLLNDENNHSRLFGESDNLHALSEDIVQSLIYLVRYRYKKPLLEIVKDDNALVKLLNSLDIICSSDEERMSLRHRLSYQLSDEVKKRVCLLVKEKLTHYNTVNGISVLLPVFLQLSQTEFDEYFNCQFLTYGTLSEAINCVKKYFTDTSLQNDAIASAILLTACFDRERRQEIIQELVLFARDHFFSFTVAIEDFWKFSDPYIREALYIVIHGAVVGSNNKEIVAKAVDLLTRDLRERPTSHLILLDCSDSLFDFAEKVHNISVNRYLLTSSKFDVWEIEIEDNIWNSIVYDYDFEKFHIRPYSMDGYNQQSCYSPDELWRMILWRLKTCGYNDVNYALIMKQYSDRLKYYPSSVNHISFKYVETAQRELVGWLLLNGSVETEYKKSYRTDEVQIDPSFPSVNQKKQLISLSYLPKEKSVKEDWLQENPLPFIKQNLMRQLPRNNGDWVLLFGSFLQQSDEKNVRFYWKVITELVIKGNEKKINQLIIYPHSHLFASEIGWRNMKYTEEPYYDSPIEIPLLQHYEFSDWDKDRAKNSDFYFLSDMIRQILKLDFNVLDLNYYRDGIRLTERFKDSSSEFFYIKKELMEELETSVNMELVSIINAEKIDTYRGEGNTGRSKLKSYYDIISVKDE